MKGNRVKHKIRLALFDMTTGSLLVIVSVVFSWDNAEKERNEIISLKYD